MTTMFTVGGQPLFRRALSREEVEGIRDFRSLQELLLTIRSGKSWEEKYNDSFPGLRRAIKRFEEAVREEHSPSFEFHNDLLPKILDWAVEVEPDFVQNLPLLEQGHDITVQLSWKQVRHILANAFLLNVNDIGTERRSIDFATIYWDSNSGCQRTVCNLAYFYRIEAAVAQAPDRSIGFYRRTLEDTEAPHNDLSKLPVDEAALQYRVETSKVKVHTDRMEASPADFVFVDFANQNLHIHQVIPSLTQEEVLFSCCPEMFVGILLSEKMLPEEVILIENSIRFSEYTGYLTSFKWVGFFDEEPPFRVCHTVAIDSAVGRYAQCSEEGIRRDLLKAYLGFKASRECLGSRKISTGHWGCGAFGGDFHVKFLQQVLAATLAEVTELEYSTYRDKKLATEFLQLLKTMERQHMTAGTLYQLLLNHAADVRTDWKKIFANNHSSIEVEDTPASPTRAPTSQ